jgi:hypothetical protein
MAPMVPTKKGRLTMNNNTINEAIDSLKLANQLMGDMFAIDEENN